jgi:hypothetical protein
VPIFPKFALISVTLCGGKNTPQKYILFPNPPNFFQTIFQPQIVKLPLIPIQSSFPATYNHKNISYLIKKSSTGSLCLALPCL